MMTREIKPPTLSEICCLCISKDTEATLIDNIYMKNSAYDNIDSHIILNGCSDHFPIISCMGLKHKNTKKEQLKFELRHLGQMQKDRIAHAMNSVQRRIRPVHPGIYSNSKLLCAC